MSMAHGLEARVPFLDLDFVHTAFSVSPETRNPKPETRTPSLKLNLKPKTRSPELGTPEL